MVGDVRHPVEVSHVRVSDSLDKRIRLGLRHLLTERARIFGGEGHSQGWGADQVGRWLYAVSQAVGYTGEPIPALDETVKEFISLQEADGSWGPVDWGNSRAMVGLSEYWEITHDAAALDSAQKAGDFYLRRCEAVGDSQFHPRGGIEGLLALWRVTGASGYLEAAEKAAACAIRSEALLQPGIHMHCDFLTPLHGFVDLFLATGKRGYLAVAQDLHAEVLRKEMWVTGGISESGISEDRDHTDETRDETCQVADWLRLSLRLWQATGEARYVDVAERTLLNHLYFDQDHSGGFCAYRSLGIGSATPLLVHDFVAWFCCSMHGLRGLVDTVRFLYTHTEDGIDINLYTPSEATMTLRDGEVSLKQVTAYPSEFCVRVDITPKREFSFCLRARIPHWARSCRMTLNGAHIAADAANGYVAITRTWKPGDSVEVCFEAGLVLVPEGVNGFAAPRTEQMRVSKAVEVARGALIYGPLVLMVDPALQTHQMYDWDQVEILVPRRKNGDLFLPPVELSVPGRGELSVPGMCFMTLGRSVKQAEKRERSVFDPDLVQVPQESIRSEQPDPNDESWKLVFLVPVSELTDRWTPTLRRLVPYEVRNNLWLLEETGAEGVLARAASLLDVVRTERWLKTTGFLMQLAREGTPL
ncbi:MAG: beta-L-arabinofuranosidase domain-containing protein [Candidatus Latescibacterota bacterium]